MASIFFKYYADVESASDVAVKKEYGVSKANVLKVLEKLLVEDIASSGRKSAPADGVKKGRKRGRKPGRKPASAKKPGKRGRKPGRPVGSAPAKRGRKPVIKSIVPKIEVS
jgi:hypothetical protein